MVYILTGWILAIAPIGYMRLPDLVPEVYETEAACLHRIEFFKNNTKYILDHDLKCEPKEVDPAPSS